MILSRSPWWFCHQSWIIDIGNELDHWELLFEKTSIIRIDIRKQSWSSESFEMIFRKLVSWSSEVILIIRIYYRKQSWSSVSIIGSNLAHRNNSWWFWHQSWIIDIGHPNDIAHRKQSGSSQLLIESNFDRGKNLWWFPEWSWADHRNLQSEAIWIIRIADRKQSWSWA